MGAASNAYLTLNTVGNDAKISLRYYQLNFFGQDEWKVRPNLSVSLGLRYEYNTPVRELNRRIENTFNDPALSLVPGLRTFIGDRTSIYDPDRNNFAPRLGFAYFTRSVWSGPCHCNSRWVWNLLRSSSRRCCQPVAQCISHISDSELRRAKCLRE